MTNKMTTLTKQAKERWSYVPLEQKKELIEKLKTYQPGAAVIELGKAEAIWKDGLPTGRTRCKAQVVSVIFGMDISLKTEKRYLFLSDIPPAGPESE